MTYAFDSDRSADREVFHREVVDEHFLDARLDELDVPCRLPVRAVVLAGLGPQIELGRCRFRCMTPSCSRTRFDCWSAASRLRCRDERQGRAAAAAP
jgi:hypothetical protein